MNAAKQIDARRLQFQKDRDRRAQEMRDMHQNEYRALLR